MSSLTIFHPSMVAALEKGAANRPKQPAKSAEEAPKKSAFTDLFSRPAQVWAPTSIGSGPSSSSSSSARRPQRPLSTPPGPAGVGVLPFSPSFSPASPVSPALAGPLEASPAPAQPYFSIPYSARLPIGSVANEGLGGSAKAARAAAAGALAIRPSSGRKSGSAGAPRCYEVVVHNQTERSLRLVGPDRVYLRKAAAGRFLTISGIVPPSLPGAKGSQALDEPHILAQAAFQHCPQVGDQLECNLSLHDGEGEALTVRVHHHQSSPLRSDVVTTSTTLEVESHIEEVPRRVVEPPPGHDRLLCGVYKEPRRCEAELVGSLEVGDEVLEAAAEGRGAGTDSGGRWLKLSYPLRGWFQALTRDGQPTLKALPRSTFRPHLRQVVTVRPLGSFCRSLVPPTNSPPDLAPLGAFSSPEVAARAGENSGEEHHELHAAHNVRAAEAERLLVGNEGLQRNAFIGRHRALVRGVF